jgi:uncharacterized membrane protein YiaA
MIGYIVGLARAEMLLNEKGYYFTILLYGLFAVVSLQKAVRDKLENIQVTDIYYGICWFATLSSIVLLAIGLWNATLFQVKKVSMPLLFYWPFSVQLPFRKTPGIIWYRNKRSSAVLGTFYELRFKRDQNLLNSQKKKKASL